MVQWRTKARCSTAPVSQHKDEQTPCRLKQAIAVFRFWGFELRTCKSCRNLGFGVKGRGWWFVFSRQATWLLEGHHSPRCTSRCRNVPALIRDKDSGPIAFLEVSVNRRARRLQRLKIMNTAHVRLRQAKICSLHQDKAVFGAGLYHVKAHS